MLRKIRTLLAHFEFIYITRYIFNLSKMLPQEINLCSGESMLFYKYRIIFIIQNMITDITITVKPEEQNNNTLIKKLAAKELFKQDIQLKKGEDFSLVFIKKSIDARHGSVKIHLKYKAYIGEEIDDKTLNGQDQLPQWKKADSGKSVLIIGSGPAGLFVALKLLEKGIKPVILERGCETSQRRKDIALISREKKVDNNSNYCFGEGGAGTFSDGKLYTRSNKRGNIDRILQIFVYFGADKSILTDAHPHIGTNKLPLVINNMRNKIIELGGEVHFNTKVTDLILDSKENEICVKGVKSQNTLNGQEKDFYASAVILATGHSASDIYRMIAKINPQSLEAKTFAAGVRVEHPRSLIDKIQYHGKDQGQLGAAEYRVTAQVDGRGVYSFCMCPGGFVVPSASSEGEIVVNGMSAKERNSKWSNAAIVVETRPEDIPQNFIEEAKADGCQALAGLYFRTYLEKLAAENGNGQEAPAQRLTDFIKNVKSKDFPPSSYTPGIVSSNLNEWLPPHLKDKLKKGFEEINKNMKGFICSDAVMIAIETRTSTPVRILRDKENCQCQGIKNLYPAGEGSGYSGGIVSSAMDGELVCNFLLSTL